MNRRRYFLPEEVDQIRAFWASRVPAGCSRFTEADVAEMRRLWAEGWRQCDIAEKFGAWQANISQLLTGTVLPGWRGGGLGHGRKRKLKRRRRNRGVSPVATEG